MYEKDPIKDPNDVLDYKTDFANTTNGGDTTNFLESGETIVSFVVTVPTGINLHDGITVYNGVTRIAPLATDVSTSITFWLSGGNHLANYIVTVTIITSLNRKVDKSRLIRVRQQ